MVLFFFVGCDRLRAQPCGWQRCRCAMIAQTWSIYTIPDSGLEAPSTGHCRVRQIGATDAAWRHGAHYRYLGRDDAPRCPSRSKAKVNCFLHALPTATCGYVGDPKGGGRAMRCWDLVYSVLTPRAANEETERGGRAPRTKRLQRYYNLLTFATIQQKTGCCVMQQPVFLTL